MPDSINAPRNPLASSVVAPHELEGLTREAQKGLRADRKLEAQVSRMEKDALSTLVKKSGDSATFLKRMYVDERTGQLELSSNALSHFLRKLAGRTTNRDALKLGVIKEYGNGMGKNAVDHLLAKIDSDENRVSLQDAYDILARFTGENQQVEEFDEDDEIAKLQANIWSRFKIESKEGNVASAASLDVEPGASPLQHAGEEPSLEARPAAAEADRKAPNKAKTGRTEGMQAAFIAALTYSSEIDAKVDEKVGESGLGDSVQRRLTDALIFHPRDMARNEASPLYSAIRNGIAKEVRENGLKVMEGGLKLSEAAKNKVMEYIDAAINEEIEKLRNLPQKEVAPERPATETAAQGPGKRIDGDAHVRAKQAKYVSQLNLKSIPESAEE